MPANLLNRPDYRRAGLCVLLAIMIFGGRVFSLSGLFSPLRVSGGSMAEAYLGEHVHLQCSRCQYSFRVDLGPWQKRSNTICPNCQQSLDETHAKSQAMGQRVLIDHAAYWLSELARFEVIALHEPKTNDLAMKRVIALPHERWEFRRGDLFINDQLLRKTVRQFLETAVLVHDDSHRVQPSESRWRADEVSSTWKTQATGFTWSHHQNNGSGAKEAEQGRGVDWLVYHHQPQHPAAKVTETCVKDLDTYNSTLARPLQSVTDLMFQAEVQVAAGGRLHLRVHDGYESHMLTFAPKKNTAKTQTILFGLCDRTLWLMANENIIERKELPWREKPPECSPQPLAIGGAGEGSIVLAKLQIHRDIHYLAPNGLADTWNMDISPYDDEYIVLGDNQPLSIDSRHWGSIERKQIVGRVMKW